MARRSESFGRAVGDAVSLRGRHLLVLEDEVLIALDVAMSIEQAGATTTVAHSAPAAHAALDALGSASTLDCAVLDVDLGDHTSEGVAERLRREGTPYVLYTASLNYLGPGARSPDAVVVAKPASPETLVAAIARALGG